MIAYIDIEVNAAHPQLPIGPCVAFVGSPSNVRILKVPKGIGSWKIDAVAVAFTRPDNSITTVNAVNVAGCWVATLPASDVSGRCDKGFQIEASGIDENGNAVTGYVLGVGDVVILPRDGTATSDGVQYYFHYRDAVPATPRKGDTCLIDGVLKWYDGTAWQTFAAGADIEVVPPSTDPADAGAAADAKATGDALAARPTKAQLDAGWWSDWVITRNGSVVSEDDCKLNYNSNSGWSVAVWVDGYWMDVSQFKGDENSTSLSWSYAAGETADGSDYTATRHRVAAPVPTTPSDIGAQPAGNYLTQHQQLTPAFSSWTVMRDGVDVTAQVVQPTYLESDRKWDIENVHISLDFPVDSQVPIGGYATGDETSLSWRAVGDGEPIPYTATRSVIGYTLGSQTTKPLQPQGDYAPATALRYDLPATATVISSASQEVVEGVTVNYGEATLADRTSKRVAITAALDELRLTFPAAVSGKVRDFGLRVEVGDGTAALTAPALVPVAPTGETVTLENPDAAIPALANGTADAKGVTLLYFSETSPGKFLVKGEQVKEVA